MNKLARLWDKFLTWLWWPAVKEAIEDFRINSVPRQNTRKGNDN